MDILFGGSFNPVHTGHLIVARDIVETVNASRIVFIPAYIQPLKNELMFPPDLRLKMVHCAIQGEERFKLWDVEIKKGEISYTINTLKAYISKFKRKPIFLMGSDTFLTFHKWKQYKEILSISTIIVAIRNSISEMDLERYMFGKLSLSKEDFCFGLPENMLNHKVVVTKARRIDISSTEIRERLINGMSIKYLVPECVEEIIKGYLSRYQK